MVENDFRKEHCPKKEEIECECPFDKKEGGNDDCKDLWVCDDIKMIVKK